jgi:spermidine/putrescine transport system permease protein
MAERRERTAGATVLGTVTFVYLAWSLLPIAYTVIFSFNKADSTTHWEGFVLRWWSPTSRVSVFADPATAVTVRHTLLLALIAAAISLLLGTGLAIGIHHLPRRVAFTFYALLVLAIAFPAVALADALYLLFSVPFRDFPFGAFGWFGTRAQVMGLTTLELPFVALIVGVRLASISHDQEEMAADLGSPPRAVVARVLLPQLMTAIGAAAAVVLSIGLGELVVTDALRSTDDTLTLARGFFAGDPSPSINALGTTLAAMGLAASVLVLAALGPTLRIYAGRQARG